MGFVQRLKFPLMIQCLLFFVPMNVYVIGDWVVWGVQWLVLKYQDALWNSEIVTSRIFLTREISYIFSGAIAGKTIWAVMFWTVGVTIFLVATILLLDAATGRNPGHLKIIPALTAASGVFLLTADIIQYGILLHGSTGFVIPVGLPVLFATAWLSSRLFTGKVGGDPVSDEPPAPESG